MIPWQVLLALTLATGKGHELDFGQLPVCGNRVVQEVVKRTGCTLGNPTCWNRSRGFCTDYIEARIGAERPAAAVQLVGIRPEEAGKGDVAVFASRSHYAYVEKVHKDGGGRTVAFDLAEYNFGTCWVDREFMVTDQFKLVGRRAGVALGAVDGGFLRPRPAAR